LGAGEADAAVTAATATAIMVLKCMFDCVGAIERSLRVNLTWISDNSILSFVIVVGEYFGRKRTVEKAPFIDILTL
jgi:hypothetical protein